MPLVTFQKNGLTRVGFLRDGMVVDLAEAYALKQISGGRRIAEAVDQASSVFGGDMLDLLDRFAAVSPLIGPTVEFAMSSRGGHPGAAFEAKDVRLLSPLLRFRKVVISGNAFRQDASGIGVAFKPPTCMIGPGDTIVLPRNRSDGDVVWEIELAFVIGKRAKYVSESDAFDYICGYMIYNDVTDYGKQLKAYDIVDGKRVYHSPSMLQVAKLSDTFCPIGPGIALKEEVPDPHNLGLRVWQNGREVFEGSTNKMVVRVERFVSFFSELFTLEPGDIITVGGAEKGKLNDGDEIEMEIEGIGRLVNRVRDERRDAQGLVQ